MKIGGSKVRDRNTIDNLLIDPATTAGVQPVGKTGWNLTFSDEFGSMTIIDAAAGRVRFGGPEWHAWYPDNHPGFIAQGAVGPHTNNAGTELEYYDTTGLSVASSVLTLTARSESSFSGYPATSGMIQSNPSYNPLYGYAEARIRCNLGSGAWPAFWMIAASYVWPPEIDIMEDFNNGTAYFVSNYGPGHTIMQSAVGATLSAWNVYGFEWAAGVAKWYLNGSLTTTETVGSSVPNEPMYLVLNQAVNATLSGSVSCDIDYVRYWQ